MRSYDVNSEAFDAAQAEGLQYFWYSRHVGGTGDFVGTCWEDGGLIVDDNGNPTCDWKANSIAKYTVEKLDVANRDHCVAVETWYSC